MADEVSQFILNSSSNIASESFIVQSLTYSKVEITKLSSISFKVTALKKTVHETILNSVTWPPDISAKPFVKSTTNEMHDRNQNNKKKTDFNTIRPPTRHQIKQRQNKFNQNSTYNAFVRPSNNSNHKGQ